jgi:hypothetical protein
MAATAIHRVALPVRLAGAGRLARRSIGELAVVVQVLLGAAVVLAAAERRSVLSSPHNGAFTGWLAGPLRGAIPALTRNPVVLQRDLRHALVAMLVAWLLVLLGGATLRGPVVVGAVVGLDLLFLLCPPLALTDLFNYLGYARLDGVHHLNPYVALPLAQHGDPVYSYSNWHRLRSPYGPLFTLLLLPTARLPLPVAYWAYKVLVTVASLALSAAVWACAPRLGRAPAAALAFVSLNPLVLVYALGGQHNDVLIMAGVMAGCVLVLMRREGAGGAALAAAVAIKASAGLLLPVVALGASRPRRAVFGAAAAALGLGVAALLAFGVHLPDVGDQSRLVNPSNTPNLIGYAAGRGGADAEVRRVALVTALAAVAACAAVARRTRRWVTPAGWTALIGLASVSWVMPWYVVWALPFAALSRSRALRMATVIATLWLAAFRVGTATAVTRHLRIDLNGTPVAQVNRRFEHSLLTDPRAANRTPTCTQPRRIGRSGSSLYVPHRRARARCDVRAREPVGRAPVLQRGGERRRGDRERRRLGQAVQRPLRDRRRRRRQHRRHRTRGR